MAFTGGEPTVRSDLPDLVAQARDLGYTEVGMTTNGRMLAAADVAAELIYAGLNRVSFSLHSSRADVHDRLSGVNNAFSQLQAGLSAIVQASKERSRELLIHSVSLLLPETLDDIDETIALAASYGATIHILQPFIVSRSNLHVAQRYQTTPDALSAAVERAGGRALELGTRVKPYNIPYCWLSSLDGIEVQDYQLATHKRHQRKAQREAAAAQAQFFAIPRCDSCPTPCPGVRVEYRDQTQMVDEIVADLTCYRTSNMVLPGTDLLTIEALRDLLDRLDTPERQISLMLGGYQRATADEIVELLADRRGEAIMLLRTRWDDPRGQEPDPGNESALLDLGGRCRQRGIPTRLVIPVPDLVQFSLATSSLSDAFDALTVALPRLWRGVGANGDLAAHLAPQLAKVRQCAANLGRVLPTDLATFDNVRILGPELARLQRQLVADWPATDWSNRLVQHRYTSTAYNFVAWSNPFWLY